MTRSKGQLQNVLLIYINRIDAEKVGQICIQNRSNIISTFFKKEKKEKKKNWKYLLINLKIETSGVILVVKLNIGVEHDGPS